jgi:hypothetical protein
MAWHSRVRGISLFLPYVEYPGSTSSGRASPAIGLGEYLLLQFAFSSWIRMHFVVQSRLVIRDTKAN